MSLKVSRLDLKRFEVSVSQFTKLKCLGLAKKNASLAVSRSLAFTIHHHQCKYKRWKTRSARAMEELAKEKACISGGVAMVSCAVEPHESENQAPIWIK